MAKLQISLIWPGCAQGKYTIKAKGFILAVLNWGNAEGPLEGWGPIGYIPIDPAGNGSLFFPGRRGIPPRATHVWAKCVSYDFRAEEDISAEIAPRFLPSTGIDPDERRLSILTDLHLSSKPWKISQALRSAGSDVVLLLGDSTNDGFQTQFEMFEACIAEAAADKLVLPVIGNHDVIHPKYKDGDGCEDYAAFQAKRLQHAQANGLDACRDPDSLAWTARFGEMDIIGLQCVVSGRKFLFPEERQLDWLKKHLTEQEDAKWHLIMCHAPLLAHNPNRSDGQPYLDKNRRLQAIVDQMGNVLFLSGHTHVSPNVTRGSAEWDEGRNNLYLNCGSVVDTATEGDDGLMAADWKDGCITELAISGNMIEIDTRSVTSRTHFPRGYYHFQRTKDDDLTRPRRVGNEDCDKG